MDGDDIELHYKKNKKKRRCRCITAIVVVVVLFVIGIVIGYFIGKMHKSHKDRKPTVATSSQAARKELQQKLRDTIDADKIGDNLRFVQDIDRISVISKSFTITAMFNQVLL